MRPDMEPFAFFLGSGRSGTTLIREIFNAHPQMAIPEETHFVPMLARKRRLYEASDGFHASRFLRDLRRFEQFEEMGLSEGAVKEALKPATDFPSAIRALYGLYASEQGKTRYGDKTPRYCLDMPMLATLFPEARFVHVVRDGRDVALSVKGVFFGPDTIGGAALYWRNRALATRRSGEYMDPSMYFEYRHEDLLEEPEAVVKEICDFLDLPFDPAMLRYHENKAPRTESHHPHAHKPPTKGLRDFRSELSPEDLRLVELLIGDALEELGYELATDERTVDQETERKLRAEVKKIARAHNNWEADGFSMVNVPAKRPPSMRRRFRLGLIPMRDMIEIEEVADADPGDGQAEAASVSE
jgi:hypothetical protein